MTQQILNLFPEDVKKMNWDGKRFNDDYWLGTKYFKVRQSSIYDGWGLVKAAASGWIWHTTLCMDYGRRFGDILSVRPAIYIPSEILIDQNNNIIFEEQK